MDISSTDYRRRVRGCWMGKNIGGTLGAPFEFIRQVNDVAFYTQELGGEPLPNDDLDLQLLWLIALEQQGVELDAHTLADYWCLYVTPHWSEYGIAKTNLRAGLPPPWSGTLGNEWRHSCGAFIRSEIWACVAPGRPDIAVRYAVEDAIVDHGDGEGTWGEVFFAALESAAFVCGDLPALIEVGLSYLPEDSGVARAVCTAVDAHRRGLPWRDVRDEILRHHRGSTLFGLPERTSPEDHAKGFADGRLGYDAPSNVALAVLALLEGGSDFGKVVTTAVNCGEDTDCTAATAGAVFGLLYGIEAIPERWIAPIGNRIKTLCLNLGDVGGHVPTTIEALSERVEHVAARVLDRAGPVRRPHGLPGETLVAPTLLESLTCAPGQCRDLATRIVSDRHRFDHFVVDVRLADGPGGPADSAWRVSLVLRNMAPAPAHVQYRWLVPEGWRVEPSSCGSVQTLPRLLGGDVECRFTVRPAAFAGPVARGWVELAVDSRPATMAVPVALANGWGAGEV